MSKTNQSWKDRLFGLAMPICAVLAALLVCSILIVLMGLNVGTAYSALLAGAFGSKAAIGETVIKFSPLTLAALSYALAKRCGFINLGAEGQFYIGGLCTAYMAIFVEMPMIIHIPVCLIVGFIGGAVMGFIPAVLKRAFGSSELITTIMFNYIALHLVDWMASGPMKDVGVNPQSPAVLESAKLHRLIPGTRFNLGFLLAIACVIFYEVYLWHTKAGFETRVVGLNAEAARYAGYNGTKLNFIAVAIAGGFAGFGGALEILGIQLRLYKDFSPGYGWDGIAASLLAHNNPIGIVISSLMFAVLRAGSNQMQISAKVPSALVDVIQALIILFVVAFQYFDEVRIKAQIKKAAKEDK